MPTPPPPDIPHDIDLRTADYLRRLRTWMLVELERRVAKNEATPQLMLTPDGQKQPTTVFKITVNATGVLSTTQVPVGGGGT